MPSATPADTDLATDFAEDFAEGRAGEEFDRSDALLTEPKLFGSGNRGVPERLANKPPRGRRVLPGFGLSLGYTLFCLSAFVLLPLTALLLKTAQLSPHEFWQTVSDPLVISAYKLSFGAAAFAALLNAFFGLVVAWVMVRYTFPGRRILDALIDFPFALPTAVAGLTFGNLYAPSGWLGRIGFGSFLVRPIGWVMNSIGIGGTDRSVGAIVIVLVFVGLPFIVRTVQPVLQEMDVDLEHAAASLGASSIYTFRRVVMPEIFPAWLAGIGLALARGIGEYGSVIFVARNAPGESEIAPQRILAELYDFNTARATAVAIVLLAASFALLAGINGVQHWARARERA